MGYTTYLQGELTITPGIDEKDWLYQHLEEGDSYFVLEYVEGDETVGIVNGQVAVIGRSPSFIRAKMRYQDGVKAYTFDENVVELVAWAKAHGSVVEGSVVGDGEDSDDYWRVLVTNNTIQHQKAVRTWPDGSRA